MVRAANVSSALRQGGYSVQKSNGRKSDRGSDGIRVRQIGADVSISIWANGAHELAEEIHGLLAPKYRVLVCPTREDNHAYLLVRETEGR